MEKKKGLKSLPESHPLLNFSGLESITVIDTSNNIGIDIFLGEVDQNPGEFQAWEICRDGLADKWSFPSSPGASRLKNDILGTWHDLELGAYEYVRPTKSLLVRFVSLDRLWWIEEWDSRRFWHGENICAFNWGCVYPRDTCDNLLEFLVLLRYHSADGYRTLDQMLRRHLPACCERHADLIRLVATLFSDNCLCKTLCQHTQLVFHPCDGCRGSIMDLMRCFAKIVLLMYQRFTIEIRDKSSVHYRFKNELLRWFSEGDYNATVFNNMKPAAHLLVEELSPEYIETQET